MVNNLDRFGARIKLMKTYLGSRTLSWMIIAVAVGSCQKENSDFQGELRIKIVDAPAKYEEINIVVRRVLIHRAESSPELGWRIVSEDVQSFDLLQLRNGINRPLIQAIVPVGDYDQIQLLFGISRLRVDGFDETISIPATISSGFTIDHQFTIEENKAYGLTFDFDAGRSVLTGPGGTYSLRPIIRVQPTDLAGSIIGAVLPDTVQAIISTSTATDSVTTLSLAQTGNNSFELVDLPEGSYSVAITSTNSAYRDTTISGITVVRRQKANIGAVILTPK